MVQWLRLCALNAGGQDSIPDWGAKILYDMQHSTSPPTKYIELQTFLDITIFLKTTLSEF